MDDILSQIIAYAPDKIDTELKAAALVQGSRNMDQEPRNMYSGGGLTRALMLLKNFNKTGAVKGLEEKLIKQYKSQGMEFIDAIKKAQIEAGGVRYEGKIKIINNAMKETNVMSDDYVDLLDMKIKLEDPDFAKQYVKFPENLKNKTRSRYDSDWAEANFGDNYNEKIDIARSREINESIDPNITERSLVDDIDDMNIANTDEFFGRKKNATGGLQRNMYNQGSSVDHAVRTIDPVQDSGNKIEEVLKAYGRYQGNRKGKPMSFSKFFELYSTENFATGGSAGQLVSNTVDGSRPGYSGDFTTKQKQKITEAFPDIELNFNKYPMGVKKYLEPGNTNLTNKDYTKILRFKKKGFTTEMGEGKNTRGESYSDEGKRLSIKDQNKIKGQFELPTGEEWDFKTHKYGIKQAGRENLLARMARLLKEKRPWTVAADRGSTKGWMMLQMNRVYENEIKNNPTGKLTYKPVFDKFGNRKIIVGFKDNTAAGKGKTYYGLNKYSKKNSTSWLEHGDYKQNQKLVDISKRALKQPNEVIMGLLEDKNFKGNNVKLNHLIHFLSGTEASSSDVLKNAISRHHQSGVAFGSATDDLALTTRTINNKIKGIEGRIANNKILPEDIQTLKNNNVYVRGSDGTLYGSGKKSAIGQFKQIESDVARSLKSGVDFKGNKFKTKELLSYLEKLGCGKAAGGRINMKTGGPTDCAIEGEKKLNKLLFQGGGTTTERSLIQKIISGGGKMALSMLNPKELIRLSNLVGPGALGLMGLYEAGSITDDVLRLNKPLDEALAGNWLTKSFLPYSEEFAKQKNLLQSGQLTGDQKEYALEMMKMENFVKEGQRIEGMAATQLLDDSGYGNIDGSPMVSKEDMNKAYAGMFGRLTRMQPYMFEQGITGRGLENEAAMNEYIDAQTARTGASKVFGGPQRMVNKAPRPKNMGRAPMTEKGRMNLDFSIPGYTPYDKAYNPSDEEVLQIYRNQGIVPATFGGKLQPGEGTKVRMGLASQGDNRSIYGSKFMEGGIASLNVKK